jgi:hypothetical protein
LRAYVANRIPSLSYEEELALTTYLAKENIFLWLDFVADELRKLASADGSYVALLSQIVERVRSDMAQGPIIEAMISIGSTRPELGVDIATKMRNKHDEALSLYSGFILGGAGRSNFAAIESILSGLMKSDNQTDRIAALRTYRVVFTPHQPSPVPIPNRVFEIFESAVTTEDSSLQVEAVSTLLDFAKQNERRVIDVLCKIVGRSPFVDKEIARRLQLKGLNDESVVTLLWLLVPSETEEVLRQVVMVLAYRGPNFAKQSMQMILSLVARGKYHTIYMLDYAAEQVGAADVKGAIEIIQNALPEQKPGNLTFAVPYLLVDVCKSNLLLLTAYLSEWLTRHPLRDVALRTLREVLGNAFDTQDVRIAESIYPTLESDARANGINIGKTLEGKTDKIDQCIELVYALLARRPQLDFVMIEANWKRFPALREFLGDQWMKEKKEENNNTHEILYDLAYLPHETEVKKLQTEPPSVPTSIDALARWMRISNLLHPRAMLSYLEDMVDAIKKLPGTRSLKEGLRSEDRFSQTFSELQMGYAFAQAAFPIVLGPSAGAGKLDLQVTIEGTPILMEVITPEMFRPLKYSAKAVAIPNRARGKIYDEFKEHLAELPKDTKTPIIIVIDAGRSEIDYEFVGDYLYGTTQFTFWVDRKTGKGAGGAWTRAPDSLSEIAKKSPENLNIISAVLCYKTSLGKDGRFHIMGMIFTNPTAQNPINESQLSQINQTVFK